MKELKMGGTMGVWAAFLLTLVVGCSLAAPPPAPTATKRSDENIQFGNQQNKPVSVLDEDALPGAFPSSETLENGGETSKSPVDLDAAEEDHTSKDEDENQRLDTPLSPSPEEEEEEEEVDEEEEAVKHHLQSLPQHTDHYHPPLHREEMVRDLPPVALASRWRPPSQFYTQHWNMAMSPVYGGVGGGLGEDGTFPVRRRRRSTERRSRNSPDPKKIVQVSLHALRTGHRHKREVHDLTRIRRDLSNNVDLDKLLREVDVVELLTLLAKPHPHRNNGYATVTYAPLAPAPPRFAPQPKLFPDFDEEEEEEEEDDGEGVGYLRQGVRPPQVAPETFKHPTVWRRSDVSKYGLSRVPGFKRSAFRANTPAPPIRALNPGDVYSLAAMLGAELDPVSHRVRRVAM